MENNTSKMVALLGKIRKQMNGAVLDTFRYYGAKYGMNYGVAIHSLRDMAKEIGTDDELSQFLFCQQVRELQIVAAWIADAAAVSPDKFNMWATRVINSEIAEQIAQGVLSKIECIDVLLDSWSASCNQLVVYTALLAASRSNSVSYSTIDCAVKMVVANFVDDHLAARGVATLLGSKIAGNREDVRATLASLPECKTTDFVVEQVAWQLDY